jgi:hypothetical protein
MGGYEMGLESAIQWAIGVSKECNTAHSHNGIMVELSIIGKMPAHARQKWDRWLKEHEHISNLKVD